MVTISPEAGQRRLKNKFNAEIGPGKRYWRQIPPMSITAAPDPKLDPLTVTSETGYAIYLSPADFEHLCVVLSMDETQSMSKQYADYFEAVTYEQQIRKKNPAVQDAYDNYQIMLRLATPND